MTPSYGATYIVLYSCIMDAMHQQARVDKAVPGCNRFVLFICVQLKFTLYDFSIVHRPVRSDLCVFDHLQRSYNTASSALCPQLNTRVLHNHNDQKMVESLHDRDVHAGLPNLSRAFTVVAKA
jgi:hypothetical protein